MGYSMQNEELFMKPATLETVDVGFYEHIDEVFNIHTIINGDFVKVPVLWTGAERAFQSKANQKIRDSAGKLILPLISIERTAIAKDPSFKGPVQADLRPSRSPGRGYRGSGAFKVVTKINQEKTAILQASDAFKVHGQTFYPRVSRKIVYDEYLVPVPTYVSITYTINLRTEYQQQMNHILTPFIAKTGQLNHFVFRKDNHMFEAFIQQDFSQNNNLANMAEEERTFNTKVEIKVLGYIIGEDVNEPTPKVSKRETMVTIRVTERLTTESPPEEGTCTKQVSLVNISEEDRAVYATKVSDTVFDENGKITQLAKWTEAEKYEPGMGDLKLGVTAEKRNLTIVGEADEDGACKDDTT